MLSLAIGKQGLNVRLANRLVDWNIDVKTETQFAEMDIAAESRRAVLEIFGDSDSYADEISRISELPGVDSQVAQVLLDNGVDFIEDFLALSQEELESKGLSQTQLEELRKLIDEYVEIVEDEEDSEAADDEDSENWQQEGEEDSDSAAADTEEYECPECSAKITVEMTTCPNCGIGLSFEYEDEEQG
jgi:N utilization substance protein A